MYRREYEHGTVYWSERTGAHEVHGEIAARWHEVGGEASFLGLPTTDELRLDAPSGDGRRRVRALRGRLDLLDRAARRRDRARHGARHLGAARLGAFGARRPRRRRDRRSATGVMSGCFEHGTIAWSPSGGPEITVAAGIRRARRRRSRHARAPEGTAFAPRA